MFVSTSTLSLLCPELVLVLVATFIFVAGAFRPEPRWWALFTPVTLAAVLGIVLLGVEWPYWQSLASLSQWTAGPVTGDALGQWSRLGVLLLALLLSGLMSGAARKRLASETLGSFLLVIAGVMLVCRANELVLLFVGLELVSIPTYVLLFLGRRDRKAAEATLKYFFLSILSSALLLYGFSFLYGLAGTTQLTGDPGARGICEALHEQAHVLEGQSLLAAAATVLIFAGLGFKITAVPFHFYAPDVYQGTTNPLAAVLATTPKIAGFVALVRLLVMTLPSSTFAWQLSVILAAVTMTLGNICALWQTNLRRLLAYSSIAHSGYMLIGLTVALGAAAPQGQWNGVFSLLFYLATYCTASVAAFATLSYLGDEQQPVDDLGQLAGLGKSQPLAAGVLAAAMFSLAGIPIFAGFWGKLTLFVGAIQAATTSSAPQLQVWFAVLAVVGALNAAIAAAYYLRVVGTMYFQGATSVLRTGGGLGAKLSMVTAGVLILAIGLVPRPLSMGSLDAASAIVATPRAEQPAGLVTNSSRPSGLELPQPNAAAP